MKKTTICGWRAHKKKKRKNKDKWPKKNKHATTHQDRANGQNASPMCMDETLWCRKQRRKNERFAAANKQLSQGNTKGVGSNFQHRRTDETKM